MADCSPAAILSPERPKFDWRDAEDRVVRNDDLAEDAITQDERLFGEHVGAGAQRGQEAQ